MTQINIENKNKTFSVDIKKLLKTLDFYKIKVNDIKKIKYGWKNVCFKVVTNNNKKLFVKCFDSEKTLNAELSIYKLVRTNINVPKLFYSITSKSLNILIYEYLSNSIPFFEYEKRKDINIENIMSEIAFILAKIHNLSFENYSKLNVPDFSKWYDIFLRNNNVIKQLGYKRKNIIESIKNESNDAFKIINQYKSFSHCDFKSNNILIKENLIPYVIDWEFSSYCYSFLDIGQLFREKNIYQNKTLNQIFFNSYNSIANNKLPDQWNILIKYVDLGNLLEMLSRRDDLNANKKIISLIDEYLEILQQKTL